MSDISPLRSFVFLGLIIATALVTGTTVVKWHEQSKRSKPHNPLKHYDPHSMYFNPYQPSMVMIAFQIAAFTTYIFSIAGAIVMIEMDRTKERRAMATHFMISAWLSFVLCLGKASSVGSVTWMTVEDFVVCVNMVIWTITVGMISAIWMRGGLEALKREAMAVPGNLWLAMYEEGVTE